MYIKNISISGFKAFMFSEINSISINTGSPVQIIIGDNGSGKSSLMSALSPLPCVSTSFNKHGTWELDVEHDGHEYSLSYNVEDSKFHSFKKDGESLNISGTSGIQEELVNEHLQYNKHTNKILFNKIKMSTMSQSTRMEFFINMNPVDLRFIKEKHMKIASLIKKYKAQLESFYKRKSEYSTKIFSPQLITEYKTQKKQLEEYMLVCDKLLIVYPERIQQCETSLTGVPDNVETLISALKQNKQKLFDVWYLQTRKMESLKYDVEFYDNELNKLTYAKDNLVTQLTALKNETEEYDKILKESTMISVSEIENKLITIDKQLDNIGTLSSDIEPFDISLMHKIPDCINYLNMVINDSIPHMTSSMWSKKKFETVIHNYKNINNVVEQILEPQICVHEQKEKEIQKSLKQISTTIGPDKNCIIDTCPAKQSFSMQVKTLTDEYPKIQKQLTVLIKEFNNKVRIRSALSPLIEEQRTMRKYLSLILDYCHYTESWISSRFTDNEIREMMNKDLFSPIHKLQHIYEFSVQYHTKQQLLVEKQLLNEQLTQLKKSTTLSTEFIKNKLKTNLSTIDQNIEKLHNLETMINTYTEYIQLYFLFDKYDSEQRVLLKQLNACIDETERVTTISVYKNTVSQLTDIKLKISGYLRELDNILTEQTQLAQFIKVEEASIKSTEEYLHKLTLVEKAINPHTGIPYKYLYDYLNKLIGNVNYFISKVFTYKLKVVLMEDTGDLRCKFGVKVNDVLVGDISDCSEGQMEVIDLAFTLAMMIQLGLHKQYPLFLDETGRCFDSLHKQNILELFKELVSQKYIYQLFIINHNAILSGGFENSDVICLRSENIMVPEEYNKKVNID